MTRSSTARLRKPRRRDAAALLRRVGRASGAWEHERDIAITQIRNIVELEYVAVFRRQASSAARTRIASSLRNATSSGPSWETTAEKIYNIKNIEEHCKT